MLIECKGIRTEDYYIPPFTLSKREIVLIYLYGGGHYYPLKHTLINAFTKTTSNKHLIIHKPLTFVRHFKEPALRKLLCPVTVQEYIDKNTDQDKAIAYKIYSEKQITANTRINTLSLLQRKLLSLYVTISKTKHILFDLDGLCPQEAEYMYAIVKDFVRTGVSAIHFDWCDEYKHDCTTYIEIQWQFKHTT